MSAIADNGPVSMLDEIALVYDNVIIERSGDAWAFFLMDTHTYDLLPQKAKRALYAKFIAALCQMPAPSRAKIIVTNQDFDRHEYIEDLRAHNPASRRWRRYVAEVDANLHFNAGHQRRVYLAVRLRGDLASAVKRAARTSYRSMLAFLRSRLFGHVSPISHQEVARAKLMAEHVENTFSSLLAPRRATPYDVARLLRHLFQRGVRHDSIPSIGPLWEAVEGGEVLVPRPEVWRKLVGDITLLENYSDLELLHGEGRITYQKFMGLANMPGRGLAFPGNEYAYPRNHTDILLDFDLTPSHEAERRRQNKEQRLSAQEEHVLSSGGMLDMGLSEARAAHREMEASFRAGEPQIALHATYCLTADSREELAARAARLTKELETGHRIKLFETRGCHLHAFADFLPVGKRRNPHYVVPIPPRTLAGSMPIADSRVGDDEGPYIGFTRYTGSIVRCSQARAIRENMPGSIALFGGMGSGKSMAMYCMFAQRTLAGYWNLLIDPKGDAKNLTKLEELDGLLHEVFIQPGSEVALPILKLYPFEERTKTHRLLTDFLIQLFNAQGSSELAINQSDAIRAATHHFMKVFEHKEGNVGIRRLTDSFAAVAKDQDDPALSGACSRIAYLLENYMENDLSSIVLSDEGDVFGERGLAGGAARSIIFYTHELRLQKTEDYQAGKPPTDEQRISQAVMSVITAAALHLASRHRFKEKVFKGVDIDEGWRVLSNANGQELLDFLLREARSNYVGATIASQQFRDLKHIKDHFGAMFMGRNDSREDVEAALTDMGITPDERTLEIVDSLGDGHFIFKDIHKQVAPMYFEPVPHRWRWLLDTTPGRSAAPGPSAAEDRDVPSGQPERVLAP